MRCDWHSCVQCRDAAPGVDFGIWIHSTTRGLRITITHRGVGPESDLPPEYARKLAAQLLDAADKADDRTWEQRNKPAEEHQP